MTCDTCIHYEICSQAPKEVRTEYNFYAFANGAEMCERYRNKSLFVSLPCRPGDTVFIIGRKYRAGRYEPWINTGKFRLSDLDKLNKTVFLSLDDAKTALNNLNKQGDQQR